MHNAVIAVIDDDESARLAVSALIRARGFAVESYASAEEFLQHPGARSECIITDIQMPGLSGIDLKRRLDAERCLTPVIMITGRGEARLDELVREVGAFCLLRKPFKGEALLDCVRRALSGAASSSSPK